MSDDPNRDDAADELSDLQEHEQEAREREPAERSPGGEDEAGDAPADPTDPYVDADVDDDPTKSAPPPGVGP